MSKHIFILVLFLGSSVHLWAQSSCERSLNEARADYSSGNLYAVPGKLADCLDDGFTKTEKIDALRLLTLTYININQQEKARETLIKLLNLKTDYQAIKNVDPSELYSLYDDIDTDIKYFIGITTGLNLNTMRVKYRRSVSPLETDQYNYIPKVSIPQIGLQFLYPIHKSVIAGAEIQYQNHRFSYTEMLFHPDENDTEIKYDSRNQGINLNLMLRYMKDYYQWKPFIEIGSSARGNFSYDIINYNSNFSATADEENINDPVPIDSVRSSFNFSLNANIGTMIKLRENYGEVKFGVSNYFRNHLTEKARLNADYTTILNSMVLKEDDVVNLVYQITITFNIPFFNFK